jgi:O-antigen biosynthesis protein WbqP
MIRFFDFIFSFILILILLPFFLILYIIGFFDTGSPLFFQERIGLHKKKFYLIKFRSMKLDTQEISTHLVEYSSITNWGSFLRKSKIDELPQLINVFKGDMSFVGPRPNLLNQYELIIERDKRGVYNFKPGITGLSQINKIDMSTPIKLAKSDFIMINNFNVFIYFKIIALTILGNGFGDRVKVKI